MMVRRVFTPESEARTRSAQVAVALTSYILSSAMAGQRKCLRTTAQRGHAQLSPNLVLRCSDDENVGQGIMGIKIE